jgi:hypothetical protein
LLQLPFEPELADGHEALERLVKDTGGVVDRGPWVSSLLSQRLRRLDLALTPDCLWLGPSFLPRLESLLADSSLESGRRGGVLGLALGTKGGVDGEGAGRGRREVKVQGAAV